MSQPCSNIDTVYEIWSSMKYDRKVIIYRLVQAPPEESRSWIEHLRQSLYLRLVSPLTKPLNGSSTNLSKGHILHEFNPASNDRAPKHRSRDNGPPTTTIYDNWAPRWWYKSYCPSVTTTSDCQPRVLTQVRRPTDNRLPLINLPETASSHTIPQKATKAHTLSRSSWTRWNAKPLK